MSLLLQNQTKGTKDHLLGILVFLLLLFRWRPQ